MVLSAPGPVRVTAPREGPGPCSASVRRGLAVAGPGLAEDFDQQGAHGPRVLAEVRSRSSPSHWVAGGSSPCSACLRRVLGLQAGGRLGVLCGELAREPPVLVVSGVGGLQEGPCSARPAGPVVGAGRGRLRR